MAESQSELRVADLALASGKAAFNAAIRSGEIVSRSHPASASIWPVLRNDAPMTTVSIPCAL